MDARQWSFIVETASSMGVKPEALRKWRERGRVPYKHRLKIVDVAKARRFALDQRAFDSPPPAEQGAA